MTDNRSALGNAAARTASSTGRVSPARRVAGALVVLVGLFWIISPLALGYPAKTQGVDDLTNAFRPVFTDAGEHRASADLATITRFAGDFQTKAVPALAAQLNMTPQQLVSTLGTQFPDVGKGVSQLPTILPYFTTLVGGLQAQQGNFHQADAIPTKNLPATSVPWIFVILGALAVVLGGLVLFLPGTGRAWLVVSAGLGVAVIAVTYLLSVPTKTQAVDNLTNAFRPVFTTQGATQTRQYLTTVENMDRQLTAQAVPALAGLLKITPAQLETSIQQNFPTVATGLRELPAILKRFDGLVSAIEHNVSSFQKADHIPTAGTPTTLLQAHFVVPAGLLVVIGGLGLAVPALSGGRRRPRVATEGRSMVGATAAPQ